MEEDKRTGRKGGKRKVGEAGRNGRKRGNERWGWRSQREERGRKEGEE